MWGLLGWRAERQRGDGGFLARGGSPRAVNTGEAVNTVGFLFDPFYEWSYKFINLS
jgi:hypothetical protein